jgi:hypothetical protein
MTSDSSADCPQGGLGIPDLKTIAESHLDLDAVYDRVNLPTSATNNDRIAWLKRMLDQQLPVIVHVDYKLGTDPHHPPCSAGHYMVLVGINSNSVYMVDPGVTLQSNGDYANSATSAASLTDPTIVPHSYTIDQFITSWSCPRDPYGVLVLTAKSSGCSSVSLPLGIVAKSLESLAAGKVGVPYSGSFAAEFGVQPYTWSVVQGQGTLPPGIQLDSGGNLSGTPTSQGAFNFTVQVTDANQNIASGVATINIESAAGPLAITTPGNLQSATSGKAYSFPLSASGGTSPYHWLASGLICPNSISGLDGLCVTDGGLIQGTPTSATTGTVSFNLQVTDSSMPLQTANKTVNLTVIPANLPPQVYSVTADPSTISEQGTSVLTCTAVDPQQLSLSYSWSVTGGTVSGTGESVNWTAPSAPGGYTATCKVTSSASLSASGSTVIQVSSTALNSSISPSSGTVGVTQFTVNGSGATQNGGVTATITLPNATTTTSHTTANGSGQYSFGPFTESATGVYSEIDSDDKSGGKSLPFSWTVTNSVAPVLSVSPTNTPVSAAAGSTNFSVSNSGTGTLSYSAAVMSGSSWLSIASGATGGNSGTINVSYSANAGAQRSGTIQVTASGASGSPVTVTVTQDAAITSNTRISENPGFDIEFAPSESDMQTWFQNSPYRDIGVYIGGCNVTAVPASGPNGCGSNPPSSGTKKTNTNLNSTWVSDVSSMGWGIMPLWVGPQASCISGNPSLFYLIDTSTSASAYNEGVSEADSAATAATALGMSNSIVYYDMEAYSTSDTSCDSSVSQFISGWVTEMHTRGFQAGVYGAPYNVKDWTTPPDGLWMFYPDGVDTASDLNSAISSTWAQKRIHQYCAGGSSQICPSPAQQTYGGVTLGGSPNQGIDLDVEDGPVFSVTVSSSTATVSGVSPNPVPSSGSNQTLTITGSGFVSGATVTYYDPSNTAYAAKAASVSSSTQIVDTQFNDASDGGTWHVVVTNPGASASNSYAFTVSAGTPSISSISPTSMTADGQQHTLTIYGANFQSGDYVQFYWTQGTGAYTWNTGNSPSIASSTQMTVSMNPGTVTDTISVRVCNSAGTCTSGSQSVSVTAAVLTPSVTSISPTSMTADGASHTLTIYGSNFQSGDYVQFYWTQGSGAGAWNTGSTPTINSASQITESMNPGTVTDTISVRVCNSSGICSSGSQSVAVTAAVLTPSVSSISPTSMTADGASHTLTIYGSNFQSGDYVQFYWTKGSGAYTWNTGSTPTINSASQITESMNPGTVTDTISVRVCNSAGNCSSGSQSVAVN